MSVAWTLYDATNERCIKYAEIFGAAKAAAMIAIIDLQCGDPDKAIARLQKFLDEADATFPPITLEKAA